MKSTSNFKLAIGLSVFAALPATAQTLITIPTLSDSVLTEITSNSTTGGGLFEQTGISVGSTSTATLIPGAGGGSTMLLPEYFDLLPMVTSCVYDGVGCSGGGEQVYDAAGNALYRAPWDYSGSHYSTATSIEVNDNLDYAYDAEGNRIAVDWYWSTETHYATINSSPENPTYTSDEITTVSESVASAASSVAGIESLANMSALVLNNLTLSTDTALAAADGTYATQTALAYGSTSTATLTLPNVSDVATIANTALGALNSISVTVAAAPIPVSVQ